MAKYECKVCGYIYNEQHASRSFDELTECPICNEGKENFVALDSEGAVASAPVVEEIKEEVKELNEAVKEEVNENPEYVVERRQEFWSPVGSREETIVADAEAKEDVLDSSFSGRIESFYSSSEPVGMAHIISDEEEKEFKPLWNSAGGTVQRVIDPFGDRSESLVKAEKVDMVMPAGTPTVEEILGEEPDAVVETAEEVISETVEEEVFFAEEEEPEEAAPVYVAEEVAKEATPVYEAEEVAKEAAPVYVAEEVAKEATPVYAAEEVAKEAAPVYAAEEVAKEAAPVYVAEEVAKEAAPVYVAEEVAKEETPVYAAEEVAKEAAPVYEAEEVAKEAVDSEFVAVDIVEDEIPEAADEDFVTEEIKEQSAAVDEYFLDEEADDDFFSEVVMDHFMDEEPVAEVVEEIVEEPVAEVVEEIVEEPVAEVVEEIVEEPVAEVVEEIVEEPVAEVVEEIVEEPVAEEPVAEEPVIKAWSFMDDIIGAGTVAGVGVAGAAIVAEMAEEKEEAAEDTITETVEKAEEPVGNDSYDFFNEEIRRAREAGGYTPLRVGEVELNEVYEEFADAVEEPVEDISEVAEPVAKAAEVKEPAGEKVYCNNLEKILILPAQLNPMPLPEAAEVEGKTVLGICADRPLVLDNPVFSTGEYNMVQYIPNSGLTSEDYQRADAIEIVVGKGNGIEKNINSKEDLRQVVNFLRLESDGCPIGIKLGAGRIERDLEFCIFAKPDYVVLNNFSVVPLPYALHRATKFLNTVQSDIDVVIALDGVKDAEELAKIIAMGADVIALRNHPSRFDEMMKELKNHARVTGHYEVQDLNVKDLCTIDREIAEYTDIYHV